MHLRSIAGALLLLLATGSVTAQEDPTGASNYANCLSGFSLGCDRDRLTDAQRSEVRQADPSATTATASPVSRSGATETASPTGNEQSLLTSEIPRPPSSSPGVPKTGAATATSARRPGARRPCTSGATIGATVPTSGATIVRGLDASPKFRR